MRSAVVFLGRTSFHRWKPGELREYRAVCSIHLGDMIRHQCGMVGVRVGEAANPGPSGSVDEELLDGLRHDLTREVPRRVRRRVMDSDSDALLVQADSDADQNPQVSALTPFEGCGRRDVIDDASTEASLGLQSTVPGCCVESHQIGSTPASSGMVRTVMALPYVIVFLLCNQGRPIDSVEATWQSAVPTTVLVTPPAVAGDDGARIPVEPRRRRRFCQFWRRNVFVSKNCWTKRWFAKNGCCAKWRANERSSRAQFRMSQRSSTGWRPLLQN